MELFRAGRPEDRPALTALWREAFGDGPEEIGRFFDGYGHPERTLLLTGEGGPASMVTWLPMPLRTADGRTVPGAYLYAVATAGACRGRGCASRLLERTGAHLAASGISVLMTVPSDAGLHAFYARQGFGEQLGHARRERAPGPAGPRPALIPVGAEEYGRAREEALAGRVHAVCSPEVLALQEDACRLSGGGLYRVGTEGCACAERAGDALLVKELLVPPEARDRAADALLALHPAARCRLRFPAGPGEDALPFAMTRWLTDPPAGADGSGYFGLALD